MNPEFVVSFLSLVFTKHITGKQRKLRRGKWRLGADSRDSQEFKVLQGWADFRSQPQLFRSLVKMNMLGHKMLST